MGTSAHEVLNAKQHAREAAIVVQAGRPGAVTIATNMAGRGTDIVLGGNLTAELEELSQQGAGETELEAARAAWRERHDAVVAAGGLHIIGTERHESRRASTISFADVPGGRAIRGRAASTCRCRTV